MAYEMEEIRLSQQIFYYLLENHELREQEEQRLYRAYTEEEQVQNLVKSQAEEASSTVERYGDVIYLIPKEENVFLGFSKAELKKRLCKSTATDKDFYLSQFVILTNLSPSSQTRSFVSLSVSAFALSISNCPKPTS